MLKVTQVQKSNLGVYEHEHPRTQHHFTVSVVDSPSLVQQDIGRFERRVVKISRMTEAGVKEKYILGLIYGVR